jgi:hypothetical protein
MDRMFYSCSLDKSDPNCCNFFEWEDGISNYNNFNNNFNNCINNSNGNNTIKDPAIEVKNRFGHHGFRHGQKECIDAALQGNL